MKFKLAGPLPFIDNQDLLSGEVEYHNGVYRVTGITGDKAYRQNLKRSDFEKLVAANVLGKEGGEGPAPAPAGQGIKKK